MDRHDPDLSGVHLDFVHNGQPLRVSARLRRSRTLTVADVAEIDVAFPAHWVAGECDGLSSRAERESLATHHLRQNQVVRAGWRPFLIDWTRLKFDADHLFDELAELLAAADRSRPPALPADAGAVDARFRGRRRR